MKKNPRNPLPDYAKYSGIAITMAVVITGGIVGGWALDKWIPIGFPLFTLLFSLGSVMLAIYIVIRDLLKKK
jgi:hypothetical protein